MRPFTVPLRLQRLIDRMSHKPFWKRIGYSFLRYLSRLVTVVLFRAQCFGREQFPDTGPALICSNHQSFADPVLVGMWSNQQLSYLAKKSLFKFAPLRWLISYLDAIPIDRDGFGISGIKETLKRLKRGETVVIFPEGTRSDDGDMQPLKPGFVALARRSKSLLLPVAIDGAHRAWPRSAKLPRPAKVVVCCGEPLRPEEIATMNDEELVAELERRMRQCHAKARQIIGR